MVRQPTNDEILAALREGPIGQQLTVDREAGRLKRNSDIAAQRAALETEHMSALVAFESAEKKAMDAFKIASDKLEAARGVVNEIHGKRYLASGEYDRADRALIGAILDDQNPLVAELHKQLRDIADQARKIRTEVLEEFDEKSQPNIFGKRKLIRVMTNHAARDVRSRWSTYIGNALHELVLSGHDDDDTLRKVYAAGLAAIPGEFELREHDYSPRGEKFETARTEFVDRIKDALDAALREETK
jgi:hypothetical protein